MEAQPTTRVLVVAHETATSASLIDAVRRRSRAGRCRFTLLVPAVSRGLHRIVDPEDHGAVEAEHRMREALPVLSSAAGSQVEGRIGVHEPLAAVQDALNLEGYDEVIVSMLPVRLSRWLRIDLPRKVAALGVPVSAVIAGEGAAAERPAA